MSDSDAQPKTRETPKAAEAFAAYVAMGPARSLRKLADLLVEQNIYKSSTTALLSLSRWSREHRWQERIAETKSQEAQRMLDEAADLDADTFLKTSRETNRRADSLADVKLDELIRMRETVRRPLPKSGASVSVNVSVEVRHLAEQLAKELNIDPEQLLADAEAIAAKAWEKG